MDSLSGKITARAFLKKNSLAIFLKTGKEIERNNTGEFYKK